MGVAIISGKEFIRFPSLPSWKEALMALWKKLPFKFRKWGERGEQSELANRKLPLTTKLTFSTGSIQWAMMQAAGMVNMIFYNQVLGVSPALCGTAFLIANVVDAVSDPLVGMLSDRFHSRWGRRHPFMALSAVPFAASIYFLYQPVGGLSETGLFIWLTAFMVLMHLSYTFFNVPLLALGAELTDDYHDRTALWGWFWTFSLVGSAGLSVFVLRVIFPSTPEYDNGLLNEGRYPLLAAMAALIVFLSVVICTIGTRSQIPRLSVSESNRPRPKEYIKHLGYLLTNRSYISVCGSWLTIMAGKGALGMVGLYAWLYYYGVTTEQLAILSFVKIPGAIIVYPLAAFLTRLLEKRGTMIFIALTSAAISASPHFASLGGIFPDNGSLLFLPLLFGSVFVGNALEPVLSVVADSQLSDVCDEHELKTGTRAEGVIYSVRTFAMKATDGFGGFIGGVGLVLIGFPEDAGAVEPSEKALNGLLFISGPFFFLIFVVGAVFMWMYSLNKERVEEIQAQLKERREAKA